MHARKTSGTQAAFTLIELLVVLAIIAVLVTIGLVIGARARIGAKESATLETMRVLDSALNDYVSHKGEMPKPLVKLEGNPVKYQVIADASDVGPLAADRMIESGGYFMFQMAQVESTKAILDQLPAKFLNVAPKPEAPGFRVPLDAFGRAIRYVHPALQGVYATARDPSATFGVLPGGATYAQASIFRSVDNSDGGNCVGNRPYFYSTGVDGDPKTHEDNLYLDGAKPNFVQ